MPLKAPEKRLVSGPSRGCRQDFKILSKTSQQNATKQRRRFIRHQPNPVLHIRQKKSQISHFTSGEY